MLLKAEEQVRCRHADGREQDGLGDGLGHGDEDGLEEFTVARLDVTRPDNLRQALCR